MANTISKVIFNLAEGEEIEQLLVTVEHLLTVEIVISKTETGIKGNISMESEAVRGVSSKRRILLFRLPIRMDKKNRVVALIDTGASAS